MTETPSNRSLPSFHFSVEIPELGVVVFQEVSGLHIQPSLPHFRKTKPGGSPPPTMPAIQATGRITMKRGVFLKDNRFREWYRTVTSNQAKRTTVTVKLIDERGTPVMTWTLTNAVPTKITGADLNAAGNDVAVESLEITHDQLTVSNN